MKKKATGQERPREISFFKPRTRKPNFVISVLVNSLRLLAFLVLAASIVTGGYVLGIVRAYTQTAPTLDLAEIDEQAQTSFFYDSQGEKLTDYKGTVDRVIVSIDEIPVNLRNAFVAVEDARFYTHNGIDVKRIVGALVSNLTSSGTQGGSTITQQLIKNSLLSSEVSYKRKIQEAYLAMELETVYTKDQILESYLNTIYLGENYYGVKTAAYGYFGKELDELTLRECAMLAGITRSPYYYNPRRNLYIRETPEITKIRTDYALRQMYDNGLISYSEYQAALNESTATVLESAPGKGSGLYDYPYYIEYAVEDVIDAFLAMNSLEDTPANRNAMEQKLRTGGYHIYLCIDRDIQTIVEQTLANWTDYPLLRDPSDAVYRQRNTDGTYAEIIQPQAAMAVVDYHTGQLKAVVGGRTAPTQRKTLNRATGMTMPVGSAIKPLSVYMPALEMGWSPASILYNMPVPIHGWKDDNGNEYYPSNYGGGGFTGPITMRKGVRQSYNTVAAQTLMYAVGVDRSAAYLRAMGVDEANINEDPFGLALGSSGLTPVQMAVGYGTIANEGLYQEVISFTRIEDGDGVVILDRTATQVKRQVFSESSAWMMVDMLEEVIASGTGTKAQIKGQTVAGKTGTNSDYRGVTFAGMTGWYSAAVWIGHDNYKPLSSKATGGNYAAPLWQAVMERIHTVKGLSDRSIRERSAEEVGLVKVTTCAVSGLLATEACQMDANGYGVVTDYWPADRAPSDVCNMHQMLTICQDTGMLATEYCPNRMTAGVVVLPIGHPLYDYIGQYSETIEKYLGSMATLQLTADSAYNQSMIETRTCSLHTANYTQVMQQWTQDGTVADAQELVSLAYSMLATYGPALTDEEYISVIYCIRQVEEALETYEGLGEAVSSLRYAMTFFDQTNH